MPPKKLSLTIDTQASPLPSQAEQNLIQALLGTDVAQYASDINLDLFSRHLSNLCVVFFSSIGFSADIDNPDSLVAPETGSIPPPSPSLRTSVTFTLFGADIAMSSSSSPQSVSMMSPKAAEQKPFITTQVPSTPSVRHSSSKNFSLDQSHSGQHHDWDSGDEAVLHAQKSLSEAIAKHVKKPASDQIELRVINSIIATYPKGITLHTTGKYPDITAGQELAKKYSRATPDPNDDVRIISDVLFESVLGLPGFLVWTAIPIIISHYANLAGNSAKGRPLYKKDGPIPLPKAMSRELIDYGQTISNIYSPETGDTPAYTITPEILLSWYNENMSRKDVHEKLFNVLRLPENNVIITEDLERVAWILLRLHPGLSFLSDTPQFQVKYAETVAARAMFELDLAGKGVLAISDLRRTHSDVEGSVFVRNGYGMFLEALWFSQFEADINRIMKFFSYEHFYVIYCKFWELDDNHDQKISLEDFLKYGGSGVINKIAATRAFDLLIARRESASKYASAASVLPPTEPKKYLTYNDFVSFIIAEEHRDLDSSVAFWFEVCDVDADGIISFDDFKFFYKEQQTIVEQSGVEPPDGEDLFCQLVDQIKSAHTACMLVDADLGLDDVGYKEQSDSMGSAKGVSLREIKISKTRGNLFDVLINTKKMALFESRDPYNVHWNVNAIEKTAWDRFCKLQYDIFVNNGSSYEFTDK